MKYLSLIITVPFGLAVILFALNNRQDISFDAFGLGYEISMPFYLFTFAVFLIAFLVGGVVSWLSTRSSNRALRKEIKSLKKEIENVKSKNLILQDQLPESAVVIEQKDTSESKPSLKLISSEEK